MQVNGIGAGTGAGGLGANLDRLGGGQGAGGSFADMLRSVTDGLTRAESNSNDAVERLVMGEDIDIHEVVLATEMESLAFELMLNVRNKLVEAYQEVFRMQV